MFISQVDNLFLLYLQTFQAKKVKSTGHGQEKADFCYTKKLHPLPVFYEAVIVRIATAIVILQSSYTLRP